MARFLDKDQSDVGGDLAQYEAPVTVFLADSEEELYQGLGVVLLGHRGLQVPLFPDPIAASVWLCRMAWKGRYDPEAIELIDSVCNCDLLIGPIAGYCFLLKLPFEEVWKRILYKGPAGSEVCHPDIDWIQRLPLAVS